MLILITSSHDNVWISLGENCCWSLLGLKGLTLQEYQWGCRSINLTSSQSRYCPVLLACSETAEVWVCESCISLSCFTLRRRWRPAVCCQNVMININVTIMKQTLKLNPLYTLSMMINIFHDNMSLICFLKTLLGCCNQLDVDHINHNLII